MSPAGYSGTPLAKKLGIKAGFRVLTHAAPDHWSQLVAPLPSDVAVSSRFRRDIDLVHTFVTKKKILAGELEKRLEQIRRDGAIWVSWPKKSSGVASEVTEDTVRDLALPLGLVDVKVCAVDETWSALKLVIRKELR